MNCNTTEYPIVRTQPVACFKYQGSHSKPVRRRVMLTEISGDTVRGYEIQEGNEIRDLDEAVIKSYTRSKVKGFERFSLKDAEKLGMIS